MLNKKNNNNEQQRRGDSGDVIVKTAEGAVRWVKKDFERWCRSYNFNNNLNNNKQQSDNNHKEEAKRGGNEEDDVIDRILESEFSQGTSLYDTELSKIKEDKGINDSSEIKDYFKLGLERVQGKIDRTKRSENVVKEGGTDIFKNYGQDEKEVKGEWEDLRDNVEWAMSIIRGIRSSLGEDDGNGISLVFQTNLGGSKFYHEGREVPEEVLDGLRRVIQTGVRMGVIDNPKREMEMRARFRELVRDVENDLMEEGEGRGKEVLDNKEDVMLWEGYADAARESLEEGKKMEREGTELRMAALGIINSEAQKLYVRMGEMQEMKDLQYMSVLRDVVKAGTEGEEGREGSRMRAMISNTGCGEEWLAWLNQKVEEEEKAGEGDTEWCMVLKLVKSATVEEMGRKIRHLVECVGYANRFEDDMGRGRYIRAAMRDMGERDRKEFKEVCGKIKAAARREEFKTLRPDVERLAWIEEFAEGVERKMIEGGRGGEGGGNQIQGWD
ncbi:hypothetical protein TrCOL_g8595 [Triparma columacea]|uniref:Uncharacterized protein n=1 Tax=Triparma columacea TaxID=722753 RepID=A0A9W7GF11_9STRA|nr:hypothetical protein TrCOL_g8595 [Triparma columacea]